MAKNSLRLNPLPVSFGTDGWRGVLGVDFTLERLLNVAIASAQELCYRAPAELDSRKIIIGYDRRFLASEMAEAVAAAVRGCDLEPLLADSPVPTPACSWAVVNNYALGALVVTASHNPPEWLGLKIKGPLGGSVEADFTKAVETRLSAGGVTIPREGLTDRFDCRNEHINGLRKQFDISAIIRGLKEIGLKLIIDPMHGSAAGCIGDLFGEEGKDGLITEIHSEQDPLFGGNPPEPLAKYTNQLIEMVKASGKSGKPALGLVFDGDGDRIAAIAERGRYCSTQLLMPLLIDHLARVNKSPGCVIKTVSGCDLMRLVAESHGREVLELPVGFKYIAKEMLVRDVLIGGEESGGIGFGSHIPERDALFTSLVLLEAIAKAKKPLGEKLNELQQRFGQIYFDRIDVFLENMEVRQKFENCFKSSPPQAVLDKPIREVISIDGIKLRLGDKHWLMFRFSGTEPLLRIYCEAPSKEEIRKTLDWAQEFLAMI
tara:strand:+ start:2133 stop:3596 length:1464 start_codon:yes stop_codon:yes gene_type:complete